MMLELPSPQDLSNYDAKAVYAALCASAGAWSSAEDPAGTFMWQVSESLTLWMLKELDERGIPRDTFEHATPEDFNF